MIRRDPIIVSIALLIALNCPPLHAERQRAVKRPAEPPVAEELIDAAMQAGTIDANTALEYKVFASYDDSRLPVEYRGNNNLAFDSHAVEELSIRYPSLPSSIQETLGPFLIPPYYEGSWDDLRLHGNTIADPKTSGPRTNANFVVCGVDIRMLASWSYLTTSNKKVSVWYQSTNAGDAALARTIVSEIDRAWPLFVNAMGGREPLGDGDSGPCHGPTPAIDMAITGTSGSHVKPYLYDVLRGAPNRPMPVVIEISRAGDLAGDPVASALHELMHAFQYAFTAAGATAHTDPDPLWMMEMASQWAQHLAKPNGDDGKEQVAARIAASMMNKPELSLDEPNQRHAYSTYLLPLFIQMKYADTAFVGRAFAARELRSTSAEAINDALLPFGGFAKVWPEFIRWNINRPPFDDYTTRDDLIATAYYRTDRDVPAEAAFMLPQTVSLPRLSSSYQHFSFRNDAIRTVTLFNGFSQALVEAPVASIRLFGLTLGDAKVYTSDTAKAPPAGASVYVLTKVEGSGWSKPIDITNRSYITFCRDARDERLEELVVIFGNSSYERDAKTVSPTGLTPRLVTNNIGCWGWGGTASYSQKSGSNTEDVSSSDFEWQRQYWPTLGSLTARPNTTFKLAKGTAKWTSVISGKSCSGTLDLTHGYIADPFLEILNYTFGGGDHHRLAWGWGVANAGALCRGGPVPWLSLGDPTIPLLWHVETDGSVRGRLVNGDETWIWNLKPLREP